MNTLRATALAGPGPTTWLYRARLLERLPKCPSTPIYRLARPFSQSSSTCGPKGKQRARHSQNGTNGVTESRHETLSQRAGNAELPVIFLRPPADYPIDDQMRILHRALMEFKLDSALQVWSNLLDLGCTSRLADGDWFNISSFVQIAVTVRHAPNLGKMAIRQSHSFGLLSNMAVESAARDQTTGMLAFMLKLVEVGRPSDAVRAFTRCKERMREQQGRDAKGLLSWNRAERLSARLEGEGLRDLMFANIAALTLLGTCDEHALFGMLDTQTNLRPSAVYDFRPFERTFAKVKNGSQLYRDFRQNVENMVLAMQCYHPDALIARINLLSASRTPGRLEALYGRIMEGSIGPNAFIRPRDLGEMGIDAAAYTNVPLAPIIWWQFIRAFERRNDVDRIIDIIDNDMPARGLQPNDNFLSIAMVHMAIIASRQNIPDRLRSKARAWADEYWRRLTAEGWHTRDVSFSRRIRVLSILGRREPKMMDELKRTHYAARDGHLGGIGPKTRAAFVECFMALKRVNDALNAVAKLPTSSSVMTNDEQYEPAISVFIRRLALGMFPAREKMSACTKALLLVKRLNVTVRTITLGPLLSIQVQGGLPMEAAVDAILQHTLDEGQTQHGIQRWTLVLSGLLIKSNQTHSPTQLELEAGLYILRRAAGTDLYGNTRTRLVAMWLAFLRPCATSIRISNADRQELIDAALAVFPGGKEGVSVGMWFDLIESLLSRADDNGFGEAWRRWEELLTIRQSIPAVWWSRMLKLLLESDHRDFALDLVREAWHKRSFSLQEGFWLRARAAGLTRKLGLEAHFEEVDGRGIKVDSRRQWREPLSLAEDMSEDELDQLALEVEERKEVGEREIDLDENELVDGVVL